MLYNLSIEVKSDNYRPIWFSIINTSKFFVSFNNQQYISNLNIFIFVNFHSFKHLLYQSQNILINNFNVQIKFYIK